MASPYFQEDTELDPEGLKMAENGHGSDSSGGGGGGGGVMVRCTLCKKSILKSDLIGHLGGYHKIQKPEEFAAAACKFMVPLPPASPPRNGGGDVTPPTPPTSATTSSSMSTEPTSPPRSPTVTATSRAPRRSPRTPTKIQKQPDELQNQTPPQKRLHNGCKKFVCQYCGFCHHIQSVISIHTRKKHPGKVVKVQVLTMRPVIFDHEETFEFGAGDLVIARLYGFPWWPGMISREKDNGKCVSIADQSYYVLFFDEPSSTTAWIPFKSVKSYKDNKNLLKLSSNFKKKSTMVKRFKAAKDWAEYVAGEDWTRELRLDYFTMRGEREESKKPVKRKPSPAVEPDAKKNVVIPLTTVSKAIQPPLSPTHALASVLLPTEPLPMDIPRPPSPTPSPSPSSSSASVPKIPIYKQATIDDKARNSHMIRDADTDEAISIEITRVSSDDEEEEFNENDIKSLVYEFADD